jgi:hypothetical protein
MGEEMYSRSEVGEGNRKASICICLNTAGGVDVLKNACIATEVSGSRMLNVSRFWGNRTAENRFKDNLGIDGGRQSKEEYRSGEGLGKHLEKI